MTRIEPLDMFPHAFHIEAIAVLEPVKREPVRPTPRAAKQTGKGSRNRSR